MVKIHRVRLADRIAGGPTAHFLFGKRSSGKHRTLSLPPRRSAELGGVGVLLVDTNRIAHAIEPSLEAMGYRLVRVVITSGRRPTLQVMAERLDEGGMTVEDCAQISHSVSAILDVVDPIAGAYMLEISSPGIDRPLVRAEDYDRFSGFEARIELTRPIDGRKRFRGRLLGTLAASVRLATETGEVRLPLSDVARAKLVLTDDLVDASRRDTPQRRPQESVDRSQTH
jgi:ribosome maturation factor RimP